MPNQSTPHSNEACFFIRFVGLVFVVASTIRHKATDFDRQNCWGQVAHATLHYHPLPDRHVQKTYDSADDCGTAENGAQHDSAMEDGSKLDALSLLMKVEQLPAGTSCAGIP